MVYKVTGPVVASILVGETSLKGCVFWVTWEVIDIVLRCFPSVARLWDVALFVSLSLSLIF